MKPKVSYLICATPRCGGYLLFEALESTGLAGIPGEYFWDDKEWAKKFEATDYADFLNKVIVSSTTPNGVFGTKLMWGYFENFIGKVCQTPQFIGRDLSPYSVLSELFPNLNYLWIMRRDKIRQAVSLWKGLQTCIWWKRVGDPIPKLEKEPEYNFDAIDYLVQEIVFHEAAWQAYFTRYDIAPFTVIYEDLVPHYERTTLNILNWLNISYPENLVFGKRRLLKQADSVSEDWVQKYRAEKEKKEETMERCSPFSMSSWKFNVPDAIK